MAAEGRYLDHLAESIDIYPTLADLCGLAYPINLEGQSLAGILENPESKGQSLARSFYYRNNALGKSIRTDRYRIVRWATESDSVVAMELYDHQVDPGENRNIAWEQPGITDSLVHILNSVRFMDENMPFQRGWE